MLLQVLGGAVCDAGDAGAGSRCDMARQVVCHVGQSGSFSWVPLAVWVGQAPQPPPLRDQAVEATGQIKMPSAVLSFNPTARTLVNLDAWFWAQGLHGGELRGSSAFGLVAVATPARLEVTPGRWVGGADLPVGDGEV